MGRTPTKDQNDAFYSGVRSAAVPFVLNDCVEIVSGPLTGRACAVISIVETEPELVLLVELADTGKDVYVTAASLRLWEDSEA